MMSDEEPKSVEYSSEESVKGSSKRSNNGSADPLPKRPRMNLWENQNKNIPSSTKDDKGVTICSDESDSEKSSSEFDSDDETSLEELAASICCLPHSEYSTEELEMFSWLPSQNEHFKSVYLYMRNKACMLWLKDPKVQLTEKNLLQSINSSSCDKFFQDIISSKLCNYQRIEDPNAKTQQNRLTSGSEKLSLKKFDIDSILKDSMYKDNMSKLSLMVIAYLERYGYANIGCFTKQNDSITNGNICGNNGTPLQVVIVGAGLSGIMAALQLQYFGCKVLVLEAKENTGGRLQTFQKDGWQVDVSPFSITGINNPINQLIKQGGLGVSFFNSDIELINSDGDTVNKDSVSRIECEINRLLLAANDICVKFSMSSLDKKHISLGEMLEALISLQTLHCKNLKKNSNALILKLMNRLQEVIVEMEQHKVDVVAAFQKWSDADEESKRIRKDASVSSKKDGDSKDLSSEPKDTAERSSSSPVEISADLRGDTSNDEEESAEKNEPKQTIIINPAQQMKVNLALSEYRRAFKKCSPFFDEAIKIRKMIKLIQDYDPASMLLEKQDLQILDWFLANLEYKYGSSLVNLSLRHGGSPSNGVDLSGGEIFVKKGYQALINSLTKKSTCFQCNTIVKEIHYSNEGIQITAINTALSEDDPVYYTGDVVVCTLPLGVLKESIENPTGTNSPQFNPVLPESKIKSINALGFGSFDKVVICFKERFWGSAKTKLFAQLKENSEMRGDFLQFYAFSNKYTNTQEDSDAESDESSEADTSKLVETTVVGIICGKAVNRYAFMSDDEVGKRALTALRELFRKKKFTVPEPDSIHVFRWTNDEYFRGVFSYLPENGSQTDIINVATPIPVSEPESNQRSRRQNVNHIVNAPRLFFAGEHTWSGGIGTIQSAMMSGLKAASDIVRHYFPQLPNNLSKLPSNLQFRKN